MVISNTPNRSNSSPLLVLAFMFALSIPLGASGAEDKKAKTNAAPKDIYKEIEAAVIAGKITKEEAQAKLKALKLKGSPKSKASKKGDNKKTIAHLENIWAELQSLVAIGKMSPEEAASVISTIKQKVFAKTPRPQTEEPDVVFKPNPQWTPLNSGAIAVAKFSVGKLGTQISITPLAKVSADSFGKVNANINRWRAQVGLESLTEQRQREVIKTIRIDGQDSTLVHINGDDQSIAGVITVRGQKAWFIKMKGPGTEVLGEVERFKTFVGTIKFSTPKKD